MEPIEPVETIDPPIAPVKDLDAMSVRSLTSNTLTISGLKHLDTDFKSKGNRNSPT